MWPKLRLPTLALSILLLGYAAGRLSTDIWDPVRAKQNDAERAYSTRLRLDAERLAKQGDYENAFARLDQAKDQTPTGQYPDPEIAKTRARLRTEIRQPIAPTSPVPSARP